MDEQTFHDELYRRGDAIAEDVSGMALEDQELDTSFECYVRELDGELVGFVYMGDCGEWAFVEENGVLVMEHSLVERVKQLTPYKGW